jgi:hypothetical protein
MYLRIWLVLVLLVLPGYVLAQGFGFSVGVDEQYSHRLGSPAVADALLITGGSKMLIIGGSVLLISP